jgi:hypothetical protein
MGFDLDDIFDIGTTFINGKPIRHVYTDLMIRSEEQISTSINLSVILAEKESKIDQLFDLDSDDNVNLDDTLSIDLIV